MPQTSSRLYSASDLLRMRRKDPYELFDGHLHRIRVSAGARAVAARLIDRIDAFLAVHALGRAVPMLTGIQTEPNRFDCVLRVDGGFVSYARLGGEDLPSGFLPFAPEIVIESISRGERAVYMHRKQQAYFDAGVRMIWMLFPENRSAMMLQPEFGRHIGTGGQLDGYDILPGFRCALADIMPPPDDPSN